MFPSAFGIFEVAHRGKFRKADLLEEAFFGRRLIKGEEIGAQNQEERFPLLLGYSMSALSVGGKAVHTFVFLVRLRTCPLFRI